MKLVLVLSALASLAIAAPFLGEDTSNIDLNHEALLKTTDRDKKSPHLKLIKKPIIIKKKLHLFRDDNEEKAGQERCAKIKLCDADKLQRATDMMKETTLEDMDVHFIGDDLEHSIKMAKAAVENLQKDLMKIESHPDVKTDLTVTRSNKEFHEDIENTKQALDNVHKNFGNLEAMSLVADSTDDADSKLMTSEERLAQWQTAMETIQRNVNIAKNIEDSFKYNHSLEVIGKSSIENNKVIDKNQMALLKTDEKQVIKMAEEMETSATQPKESQIILTGITDQTVGHALDESNKSTDSLQPEEHAMDQTKWAATVMESLKKRAKSLNETVNTGNKTLTGNDKEIKKLESRNGGSTDQQEIFPLLEEEKQPKLADPIMPENRDNSINLLNKDKEDNVVKTHIFAAEKEKNLAFGQMELKSAIKHDEIKKEDTSQPLSTSEKELKVTENKSKKFEENIENIKTSSPKTIKAANTFQEMDEHSLKDVEAVPELKNTEMLNIHESKKSTTRNAVENENLDKINEEAKNMSPEMKHPNKHHHHHHQHLNNEEIIEKSVGLPELLNQPNMKVAEDLKKHNQPSHELSNNNQFKSVGHKMWSHFDAMDTQRNNMDYYDMDHSMKAADSQIHNTFHGMNQNSNPMFLDQHHSMDFDVMSQNSFPSPTRMNMMPPRSKMHMREPASKHATDYMHWKHEARTSYGASEPIGASSGGAVSVFPNANVGNCAIPLLLSCNPSVVSGSLAKSHVGYSAPSYRDGEEFNYLRKRDVKIPHTDNVIPSTKIKRMSSKH